MRPTPILTVASLVILLAACQPADSGTEAPAVEPPATEPGTTPTPDPNALTAEGWNGLRIGMTRAEVEAAMGATSTPEAMPEEPEICDQFRPNRAPEGVVVMVGNGLLSRISVFEPSTLVTTDGFGVGSAADGIKAFYGDRAVVTPHTYNEAPAEDIIVWEGGAPAGGEYVTEETRRGVRYEIGTDGRVIQIHVGGPDIQLVEGCA